MALQVGLLCIAAYLLGAMPFGKWIAAAKGVDILNEGSGNIGATNVWRTLGPAAGLLVFLLDAAKGYLPALVGGKLPQILGESSAFDPELSLLVGVCAVLGHSASVFLRFRGGKSVATSLGVLLAATPLVAGLSFGLFLVVLAIFRFVSLASICGVAAAPILAGFMRYPATIVFSYGALAGMITWRHRANIRRLARGEEYRFGGKSDPPR
jgi:glycerol-3-phosphate acyltransferase PlsY